MDASQPHAAAAADELTTAEAWWRRFEPLDESVGFRAEDLPRVLPDYIVEEAETNPELFEDRGAYYGLVEWCKHPNPGASEAEQLYDLLNQMGQVAGDESCRIVFSAFKRRHGAEPFRELCMRRAVAYCGEDPADAPQLTTVHYDTGLGQGEVHQYPLRLRSLDDDCPRGEKIILGDRLSGEWMLCYCERHGLCHQTTVVPEDVERAGDVLAEMITDGDRVVYQHYHRNRGYFERANDGWELSHFIDEMDSSDRGPATDNVKKLVFGWPGRL